MLEMLIHQQLPQETISLSAFLVLRALAPQPMDFPRCKAKQNKGPPIQYVNCDKYAIYSLWGSKAFLVQRLWIMFE